MKQLTLGSLFDGIGGFPLAAQRCGIKTVWASEIDPNCIEITKRHFPRVLHLGDITKIHGGKIPPVDIISFGSPCQDLSKAGGQKGIDGERSKLFRDAVRIIYEMREATNGRYPTFIIWENVNGAFSSNDGNDFRTVLEEITNTRVPMPTSGRWATAGMVGGCSGGASVAWRQLDSQFWGVPQRRKRIFLVGDFRAERSPQILFECESLLGYVRKGKKEREKVAATLVNDIEVASGINAGKCIVDFGRTGERVYNNPDKSRTITASGGGWGSSTGPYLLPTVQAAHSHAVYPQNTVVYDESQISSPINKSNPKINAPCHTLSSTTAGRAVLIQMEGQETPLAVYPINDGSIHGNANGLGFGVEGQESPTLTASDRHAVAVCYAPGGFGSYSEGVGTLVASMGKHGRSSSNLIAICYNENGHGNFAEGVGPLRSHRTDKVNRVVTFERVAFFVRYVLRKLTPLECERLQGFPDYWTKYNSAGGVIADTPRYTALGNSLTVQCAERVFRGIMAVVCKNRLEGQAVEEETQVPT